MASAYLLMKVINNENSNENDNNEIMKIKHNNGKS